MFSVPDGENVGCTQPLYILISPARGKAQQLCHNGVSFGVVTYVSLVLTALQTIITCEFQYYPLDVVVINGLHLISEQRPCSGCQRTISSG